MLDIILDNANYIIIAIVFFIGTGWLIGSESSKREHFYRGYSKAVSDILSGKAPNYKCIEVDCEVEVSNDAKHWKKAYFASGSKDTIKVWANGATSKTAHGKTETYKYLNLEIFNYVEKAGML